MSVPIGGVIYWPQAIASAPSGYLVCDGRELSRATYATLFAALGTTHGAGDGITTFNLPDLRDRFVPGAGNSYAVAAQGGSATWTPGTHVHTLKNSTTNQGNHGHGTWTLDTQDTTPPTGLADIVGTLLNVLAPLAHQHITTGGVTREAGPDPSPPPHMHDLSGTMGSATAPTVSQLPPYTALYFLVRAL